MFSQIDKLLGSFNICIFQIKIYFKALGLFDTENGFKELNKSNNKEDWLRKKL